MKTIIKKFLAIIAILGLFTFYFNYIFFPTSFALKNTNFNYKQEQITSKQLIKIILNKGLNSYGIKTFLDIRGVTINDIKNLKTKKEKILFIKKLFGIGLTNSQIQQIKKNNGFTSKGLNLLNSYLSQNNNLNFSNNFSNNFSLKSPKNFVNKNFLSQIKPGIYKINYSDIIPGKNAGVIQANFVGEKKFPSKLILEEGFSFEINKENLAKNLKRTNNLLNDINNLKKQNIDFGKLEIKNSLLQILPDRLRYTKEINLSFKTQEEYDNIKKYLSSYFNPNQIKVVGKNTIQSSKKIDFGEKNFSKNLILACSKKTNNSPKCKNLDFKNLEKIITFKENIDFSIIPITLEDIKNNNIFIKKDPKNIKITKQNILKRFEILKQINLKKDFGFIKNIEMNGEIPKHNMNDPKYCDIYYGQELKKAEHENKNVNKIKEKIKKCKVLQQEVNKVTKATYKQNLLNGFTLGESKNYSWSTNIYINSYVAGKVKVFEFSFNFYYLYGIGIRIPIIVEAEVKDSIVHDYETEKEKAKVDFETKIKLKTINGDPQYYKDMGLSSDHIFDGQELVLKFSSGIKFHLWTPFHGNIDYEKKFVTLLVKKIENTLRKMGVSQEKIEEFKRTNTIDFSRDFTPPLAGENILNLLTLESDPIILFSIYGVDLLGKIGLHVDIDGRITAKCEAINAKGGCPAGDKNSDISAGYRESSINFGYNSSKIHFDKNKYYIGKGKAYFNAKNAVKDELSMYSNFGVKFSDFRYHPILLLTLYALAGVGVPNVPYIGDLVVWSPEIDIYTLKFSSDSIYLKTHSGTNGVFDISTKNKIYSTSSTLKEISSIEITKKENIKDNNEKKLTPRSEIIIKPESNTMNGNSIFYRTDGKYPTCKADGHTKIYFPGEKIWPEAKDELVNQKTINIKAIACDMFNPNDLRARKTYKKNVYVNIKNYYHKPIIADLITTKCINPTAKGNKNYIQNTSNGYIFSLDYLNDNTKWLTQEETDILNFKMPRYNQNQKNYIKIMGNEENNNYIIKYKFEDKNPKTINNFYSLNLNTQNTTFLNNTNNTSNNDICNSNSWKTYNGEIFVAGIKPESEKNIENDNRIFYNSDKILKAVKCIKKADGKYFQSLMTIANIKVVNNTPSCSVSNPIDQNGARVHINNMMKKDIIDPINFQNKFNMNQIH